MQPPHSHRHHRHHRHHHTTPHHHITTIKRVNMPTNDHDNAGFKATITAYAMIPFAVAIAIVMTAGYVYSGGVPMFGSVGADVATWVSSFVVFAGLSFGAMFIKLPGV